MKQLQLLNVLGIATTVSVFATSPVRAEVVQVTKVQLNPIENGLEVILETPNGKSPRAFTTRSGQNWVADLIDTKLVLPNGKPFRQERPIKGIRLVLITQQTANSIRVSVTGETEVPQAQVIQSKRGLVLSLTPVTNTTADLPQRSTQPPASSPSEEPVKPEAEPTEQPDAEGEEQIDVTVTATRTEEQPQNVPRSLTVINREQIEQQTELSRDVGEILGKLVPGLSPPTQSSSSFGQTLRGRNVQVLIDGVPLSTTRNTFHDLRTIDPSAIERIEVLRGPSAIYGDGGTGGVVNIITRTPSEERLASQTQIGIRTLLPILVST